VSYDKYFYYVLCGDRAVNDAKKRLPIPNMPASLGATVSQVIEFEKNC